jgi:hypothetical protein
MEAGNYPTKDALTLFAQELHELISWLRQRPNLSRFLLAYLQNEAADIKTPKPGHQELMFLTPNQRAILDALDGQAMKTSKLSRVTKIDRSKLFRRQCLAGLKESGRVRNIRGLGFYRPDRPPPDLLENLAPTNQTPCESLEAMVQDRCSTSPASDVGQRDTS